MLFRKTVGALSAVLIAGLGVIPLASIASADAPTDPAAAATTAPADVTPTPDVTSAAPDPVLADTTDVAPLLVQKPTPPAPDPKKVWVCKYVGQPGVDESFKDGKNPIEVSVSALKGFAGIFPFAFADKQVHSVAISFAGGDNPVKTQADCPAPVGAPAIVSGWYTWQTPNYVPDNPTLVKAGLPQVYVGKGQIAPEKCGVTYQQDFYEGTQAAIDAVLADGQLSGTVQTPEDASIVKQWKFVSSEACPPPPPAPQQCKATGTWYTEDIAPTLTPDGLAFTGTGGAAVNWLHPATGNVQGFTGATYTLTNVAGYQTAFRFVVNPNAGTLHYASITVEPYMNGWVAGQPGTFAITPSSLAWSSKIGSGPGSQGQPIPLSQFGTIWPLNQFISIGFHLGSANPPTTYSTVSGATGCITADFVSIKPADLSGKDTRDTTPVCTDPKDGTALVQHFETPWTQTHVWKDGAWVLDSKVYGDETLVGTSTVPDSDCTVTVKPLPPVVTLDYCGTNRDAVDALGPNNPADFSVAVTKVTNKDGSLTWTVTMTSLKPGHVIAAPGEGDAYVLNEQGQAVFTVTTTNEPCPVFAPKATITEKCVDNRGVATVVIDNTASNVGADFPVEIDGARIDNVTVEAGQTGTATYSLSDGDHKIQVLDGGDGVLIASETFTVKCMVVITPTPTPTPPVTPPAVVRTLAQTGANDTVGLLVSGMALIALGGGLVVLRIIRRRASVR